MAYFAKRIRYCANIDSFVALIGIANKKGGKIIKFVLYRYGFDDFCEGWIFKMIEFSSAEESVAKRSFPFGPSGFWNGDSDQWKKTTNWLYEVAAGGGYQIHHEGDWVKVGRPIRWKDRRRNKKNVLRFGELAHIYMMYEEILDNLRRESYGIGDEIDECSWDPILEEEIYSAKDKIEDEISQVQDKLVGLKEEMKYARRSRNLG